MNHCHHLLDVPRVWKNVLCDWWHWDLVTWFSFFASYFLSLFSPLYTLIIMFPAAAFQSLSVPVELLLTVITTSLLEKLQIVVELKGNNSSDVFRTSVKPMTRTQSCRWKGRWWWHWRELWIQFAGRHHYQSCWWQVTAKHTCTLPVWLCRKWHSKLAHGFIMYTESAQRWQQLHMAPPM